MNKNDLSHSREDEESHENSNLISQNQEDQENEGEYNNYSQNEINQRNNREDSEHRIHEEENLEEAEEVENHSGQVIQNQNKPYKKNLVKNEKYHQGIERISEVENEDEKYHSIFEKINQDMVKQNYQLDEQKFDELSKPDINSYNVNELFKPALYDNKPANKYKPEINQKSKLLAEEKKNKTLDISSKSGKTPVELELYEDALKRKEKQQKLEYNNMMGIMLNASKTKISNNSHRIAINKIEKMIESAVNKYEKEKKKLSFIEVGEILTELKLFREIFLNQETEYENKKKYQTYKDIKSELGAVKEREKRKKAEVDFFEQLWICLNPENNESIKSDIFTEFMKILFSPVASSVKEITSVLQQFLKAAFFLNLNQEEEKRYVSPITGKNLTEYDIWTLEKLVQEFLSLKENILAYQSIHNPSKKLNFQPNAGQKKYVSRSNFFEERIPVLMNMEKMRLQVIEDAKKELEKNELKECTFKPKINKPLILNDEEENYSGTQPVHEKLYSKYKEKQNQKDKHSEELKKLQENNELSECTFKPELVGGKTFDKSMSSVEKPKGFNQTVERMRKGIIENLKKKYLAKNIPKGENYEKLKKANIKPPNITDLKQKDVSTHQSKVTEDDQFIQMEIALTNGKMRVLKIHKNDDPYEVAANLAKIYSMKDEVKDRLAQTILQFVSTYLRKRDKRRSTRRLTLRMNMTNVTNSGLFDHSVLNTGNDINLDKI